MSFPVSNSVIYSGQEDYGLDEKGRVTVPVRWRQKDLEAEVFHLVPDSKGACLRVMRPERFAQVGEEVRTQPGMDAAKHRLFMRQFYANSFQVAADKQGRIMIPKAYCERLRLSGSVRLLGCGDFFEIWNQQSCASRESEDLETFTHYAGAMGL